MSKRLYSASIFGVEAHQVTVEVQLVGLTQKFSIVGLPDNSVREARHRVRCAIESSGFAFPRGDLIVNLGPAQVPKFGAQLDLAIALGVLCISGELDSKLLRGICAVGELAFDGSIRAVSGIIAAGDVSRANKLSKILIPSQNRFESKFIDDIEVVAVSALAEAVQYLKGQYQPRPEVEADTGYESEAQLDFDDVASQHSAKRALTICAAGRHNVLMVGPPGSGKSMLAKRLTSILPPLSQRELIEVLKIRSVTEPFNSTVDSVAIGRPFRSPHHSASLVGLIGGGAVPRPGEISLSHHGVLFLDELPEFKRDVLDALRQPLETGEVDVCRAKYNIRLPANFTLLAAMNPCPCGYFGSSQPCICGTNLVQRYRSRVSGPILDRIDIHIWIDSVSIRELAVKGEAGTTKKMIADVTAARQMQQERYQSADLFNSELSIRDIRKHCELKPAAKRILEKFGEKFRLTGRGYVRVLRLARTVADLERSSAIQEQHLLEAVQYRPRLSLHG